MGWKHVARIDHIDVRKPPSSATRGDVVQLLERGHHQNDLGPVSGVTVHLGTRWIELSALEIGIKKGVPRLRRELPGRHGEVCTHHGVQTKCRIYLLAHSNLLIDR